MLFFNQSMFGRQHDLPHVDTSVLRTWSSLVNGSGVISSNGLYVGYGVSHSIYNFSLPDEFVFKSLDGRWEIHLDSVAPLPAIITADNRFGIVKTSNNRLYIQELGKDKRVVLPEITYNRIITAGGKEYLLFFRETYKEFGIYDLSNNMRFRLFSDIQQYTISESGNTVYMVLRDDAGFKINRLTIPGGSLLSVWQGKDAPSSLVTDKKGEQVSFKCGSSLWYYNQELGEQARGVLPSIEGDCNGLMIERVEKFSESGKYLFVRMQGPKLPPLNPAVNPVQVFSYQDAAFDVYAGREQSSYLVLCDLNKRKLIRLEQENEKFRSLGRNEDIALVRHCEGAPSEYYWNDRGLKRDYLVSLPDGKRIAVGKRNWNIELSPLGRHVLYQDEFGGDVFCIDIKTGNHTNLTSRLPIPLADDVIEMPITSKSRRLEFYTWSGDEDNIIVYDRYDIWQLDVKGVKAPINLTNGYGREHHIVFRFCQPAGENAIKVKAGEEVVLSAFNEETKDNGFYKIKLNINQSPTMSTMGAYVYVAPGQISAGEYPQKSRDKGIYLVWRMSTRESPNYFWTEDFKHFTALSHIYPEKKYQWHTSELISFKTKDGVRTQAVLYKPDNFDSTKKYPVLFNYYEHESGKLNAYIGPEFTDQFQFNYPMMLARGYLICLTDIHFKTGETALSVVDAVEGAADHLSRLSYVDSTRYGVCGGSFGGYESSCLATFSRKFAAAVTISGFADLVSAYGNVPGLRDEEYENRQLRMGLSLSADPERYLRNSPVAYTKSITTPILIVNTTLDGNVNVQQGIEYFISLRREGKRAWMLRYQNPDHGVSDPFDQADLYTRMNQFFDHYLKGSPAPVWMTLGISVNQTGVHSGFTYDSVAPSSSRLLLK
jgi:dipeptidyl aminopeptidase/acylaminoacyl peptidase